MPEVTALGIRTAASSTLISAKNLGNLVAFPLTRVAVTVNARPFTQMLAGTLLKTRPVLGKIADFFTLKVQKEQISAQMIFRIRTGEQTSNQMFFI